MNNRIIKPVSNNNEKAITYSYQKARLNAAIKHEFYLEALLIDYALLEDRLRSYMFHIGLLHDRESYKISGKTPLRIKKLLKPIINEYREENEDCEISVSNISKKIKIVRCIAKWAAHSENKSDNQYLVILKSQFESLDIGYLLLLLGKIEKWKNYRNEIVHALMNKNVDSLNSELFDKVIEGKLLAESLDNQLKLLKKGNKVRKSVGLL